MAWFSSVKKSKKVVGLMNVGSVKTMIEEFFLIKNNYLSINQELLLLRNSSIKNANEIRDLPSVLPAFMGGTVKQKYGNIVQIYQSAQNERTYGEIEQIITYIGTLTDWLKKVSTITDETKLTSYFRPGEAQGQVGGFIKTLTEFTQLVSKVNLDVGNSTKQDNILITEENTLLSSYRKISELTKSFNLIPGTCIPQIKNFYISEMQKLIAANLAPNSDIDKQSIFINNIFLFNDYTIKSYLGTCDSNDKFSKYKQIIESLFANFMKCGVSVKFGNFNQMKEKIYGAVSGIATINDFTDPEKQLYRKIIRDFKAFDDTLPNLKRNYGLLLSNYIRDNVLDLKEKERKKLLVKLDLINATIGDTFSVYNKNELTANYLNLFQQIFNVLKSSEINNLGAAKLMLNEFERRLLPELKKKEPDFSISA